MHVSTDSGSGAATTLDRNSVALARSKEDLAREFRNLIRDGEAFMRATTNLSGEALAQAREQFGLQLAKMRTQIGTASRVAVDRSRKAALATDEYVHTNPWPAIGAAAAVGFLIGAVLSRR